MSQPDGPTGRYCGQCLSGPFQATGATEFDRRRDMVRNPIYGLFGGVLLAVALVGAQSANAEGAKMVLARKLKTGSTTYKATIKTNVQGMDIEIEQSQKQ